MKVAKSVPIYYMEQQDEAKQSSVLIPTIKKCHVSVFCYTCFQVKQKNNTNKQKTRNDEACRAVQRFKSNQSIWLSKDREERVTHISNHSGPLVGIMTDTERLAYPLLRCLTIFNCISCYHLRLCRKSVYNKILLLRPPKLMSTSLQQNYICHAWIISSLASTHNVPPPTPNNS